MKLSLITFPSRMFTYNKQTKNLCAEASDLVNRHLQQIYDDACDVGFAVISDVSGNEITFYLSETKKDAEGEVTAWEYQLLPEFVRKFPECSGMTATIFND